MLGLSREELEQLYSFGKSTEEVHLNKYGKTDPDLVEIVIGNDACVKYKVMELILANNAKIAAQLKQLGINLSE